MVGEGARASAQADQFVAEHTIDGGACRMPFQSVGDGGRWIGPLPSGSIEHGSIEHGNAIPAVRLFFCARRRLS